MKFIGLLLILLMGWSAQAKIILRIDCVENRSTSMEYKNGKVAGKVSKSEKPVHLSLVVEDDNTATLLGNAGTSKLKHLGFMYFTESTGSGNKTFFRIIKQGNKYVVYHMKAYDLMGAVSYTTAYLCTNKT